MTSFDPLPPGLAQATPGPELAALLGGVDITRVAPDDVVVVLRARSRQANHDSAQLLRAVYEAGLADRDDPDGRLPAPDEFGPEEARAALVWSKGLAEDRFWLYDDLTTRMPAVWSAMNLGPLDEARARIFSDWTRDLAPELARRVVEELLPIAPSLLTGALREKIQQWAIALDPEWAARRTAAKLRERRVSARHTESGTANLSGLDLPVERVAIGVARLDTLASVIKVAGHPDPIGAIRADLLIGMVDGLLATLDDDQIVEAFLRSAEPGEFEPDGPARAESEPAEDTGDIGDIGDIGDTGDVGEAGEAVGVDEPNRSGSLPEDPTSGAAPSKAARSRSRRGRVELQLRLSPLLGLDESPATLVGWGPVGAPTARRLAAALRRGQWRVAVCGPEGELLFASLTRRRPGLGREDSVRLGAPSVSGRSIVELAVEFHDLLALDPITARWGVTWGAVVTDLQRQVRDWVATLPVPDPTTRAGRAVVRLGPSQIERRLADAATARWVRSRDRVCHHVACRQPAGLSDLDHTRLWSALGTTAPANLSGPCPWHHRLRHRGRWQLRQPRPGRFRWTSRAGAVYDTRPPPVIDELPSPIHSPIPNPEDPEPGPFPNLVPSPTQRPFTDIDDPVWINSRPPAPEPTPPPYDPMTDPPPF